MPFEIGWTASVHMPQVWMPVSSGSSGEGIAGPPGSASRPAWVRSISACPMPSACAAGSTNSIARNHRPSRRDALPKPITDASSPWHATQNRSGSVVSRCTSSRRSGARSSGIAGWFSRAW